MYWRTAVNRTPTCHTDHAQYAHTSAPISYLPSLPSHPLPPLSLSILPWVAFLPFPLILLLYLSLPLSPPLPFLFPLSNRVLDQHKLTPDQWEERILNWWIEHKSMLRYIHTCIIILYTYIHVYMYIVYGLSAHVRSCKKTLWCIRL